jgi:methylglutamate dehydrogenase subunit D
VAEVAILKPRGAFDDILAHVAPAPPGHSLRISERRVGLATVMALAGRRDAIAAALGIAPPTGSRRIAADDLALIGTGPDVWLAVKEKTGSGWASGLAERLVDAASVSDQSSGYAVLRLEGAAARELLSRGAFIDFHPSCFGPGSAAVTVIAHMGVILWQIDDAPTYEVALFRSYAASFWHWIEATSAAMGVVPLRADS